jgi:2,5-furandicarboxylate decarboxylase 1
MAAFGSHYDIKQVIVVDEDVDIHDPRSIERAVATRFHADQDLSVVSGGHGSKLDPSSSTKGVSAKLGIDATIPLDNNGEYSVMRIPGEDELDLDHWRCQTAEHWAEEAFGES